MDDLWAKLDRLVVLRLRDLPPDVLDDAPDPDPDDADGDDVSGAPEPRERAVPLSCARALLHAHPSAVPSLFADRGMAKDDFAAAVWFRCPHAGCGGAVLFKVKGTGYPARKENFGRCRRCAKAPLMELRKDAPATATRFVERTTGKPLDLVFSAAVDGNQLFAYNAAHVEYLYFHVAAELRVRPVSESCAHSGREGGLDARSCTACGQAARMPGFLRNTRLRKKLLGILEEWREQGESLT